MNGDGHLDILHGSPRKQIFTPVIFLGDGKGGWRYWSEVTWPRIDFRLRRCRGRRFRPGRPHGHRPRHPSARAQGPAPEDPRQLRRRLRRPQFEVPGKGGDASTFASRAVEVGDWNGDGRLDVVALGEGARQVVDVRRHGEGLPTTSAYGLVIYPQRGAAPWQALSVGDTEASSAIRFAFANLNGDDRIDLVSASNTHGKPPRALPQRRGARATQEIELGSIPAAGLHLCRDRRGLRRGRPGRHRDQLRHQRGRRSPRSGLTLHTRDAEGVWRSRLLFVDRGRGRLGPGVGRPRWRPSSRPGGDLHTGQDARSAGRRQGWVGARGFAGARPAAGLSRLCGAAGRSRRGRQSRDPGLLRRRDRRHGEDARSAGVRGRGRLARLEGGAEPAKPGKASS